METLSLALLGLLMVIAPQLMTLWYKHLLYFNSPFTADGNLPHAEIVCEATIRAREINSKWNNRTLNKYKRIISTLGIVVLIAAFVLAFNCEPYYFFLTIDTILCGLCWIYLETKILNFCFECEGVDKATILTTALIGPFIVFFAILFMSVVLAKLYVLSGFDIEKFNRFITEISTII